MDIPYQKLSESILEAVIKEFVLREGTDYGETELALSEKISQVLQQLKSGKAKIVYDQESESCSIVTVPLK